MVKQLDPLDITSMTKRNLRRARKNLRELKTFSGAVGFFMKYNFAELDEEDARLIVCKTLLYTQGSRTMIKLLRTRDDEYRYLQILDGILASVFNGSFQNEEELKQMTVDRLFYMINRKAKVFKVDVQEHNFYCYWTLTFLSLKNIYANWSTNIFQLCAAYALKDADEHRQLEFLQIICEEKAFQWTKYFEDSSQKMLRNSDIYNTFSGNSIIECEFQGKSYKFITVATAEALSVFINDYLTKAKIVGIDCEFGRMKDEEEKRSVVAVLQLSTDGWFCLVDIQELCEELTTENPLWTQFFKKLFHSKKLCIGFAFSNDFAYLVKTFTWLKNFFEEYGTKVLCLQRLSNEILLLRHENEELQSVFSSDISDTCSLAKLSKEILGFEMDKTMQTSDWTQRPLTPFQKVYAVLDALICVLIYKEFQRLLEGKAGKNDAVEIMKKGFIRHY